MKNDEQAKHVLLDQTCSTCKWCNIGDNICYQNIMAERVIKENDDYCNFWEKGRGLMAWPMDKPNGTIYYLKYEEINED